MVECLTRIYANAYLAQDLQCTKSSFEGLVEIGNEWPSIVDEQLKWNAESVVMGVFRLK